MMLNHRFPQITPFSKFKVILSVYSSAQFQKLIVLHLEFRIRNNAPITKECFIVNQDSNSMNPTLNCKPVDKHLEPQTY